MNAYFLSLCKTDPARAADEHALIAAAVEGLEASLMTALADAEAKQTRINELEAELRKG